jgi:hypothetical protein
MPQMMHADFIALPCASNLQMRFVSAALSSDLRPRVSFFILAWIVTRPLGRLALWHSQVSA